MSVLSDSDIAREIAYGDLEVEPVDFNEQLQPCSLDIRLGNEFAEYSATPGTVFDVRDPDLNEHLNKFKVEDSVLIRPDDFFLANTVEDVSVPDYLGVEMKGRSSIARLGIEVHSTAGWVDPGFSDADLVLELSNNSRYPVRIYPGMRIAQLIFSELTEPAANPYNSDDNKYQGQKGAVGSRIYEDHDE